MFYRKSLHRSSNDLFVDIGFWGSSNSVVFHPLASKLWVFIAISGCGCSRLYQSWGDRNWNKNICNNTITKLQSSLFLPRLNHFLKKCSQDCYTLWLISQVLKKLMMAIFANTFTVFIFFVKKKISFLEVLPPFPVEHSHLSFTSLNICIFSFIFFGTSVSHFFYICIFLHLLSTLDYCIGCSSTI